MKRILFLFLISVLAVPSFSQKDVTAKSLLDRTYETFRSANGIQAKFSVCSYKSGKKMGASRGSILIKGTKFLLKTVESTIWFDGKTQWNYVYKNQEVNITNPTSTELQNINPYYILSMYQRGFNYTMGKAKKEGKEVILTAQHPKNNISKVVINFSSKDEPQSIFIIRRGGSRNDLYISGYKIGGNFKDDMFVYNKKKYPKVEVVDLR